MKEYFPLPTPQASPGSDLQRSWKAGLVAGSLQAILLGIPILATLWLDRGIPLHFIGQFFFAFYLDCFYPEKLSTLSDLTLPLSRVLVFFLPVLATALVDFLISLSVTNQTGKKRCGIIACLWANLYYIVTALAAGIIALSINPIAYNGFVQIEIRKFLANGLNYVTMSYLGLFAYLFLSLVFVVLLSLGSGLLGGRIGEKLASRPENKKLIASWNVLGGSGALILIILSALAVINTISPPDLQNTARPMPTPPSLTSSAVTSPALQTASSAQVALLKSYCNDLLTQNYTHAYTLLAPDAKVEEEDHLTLDQFLTREHNDDELYGTVTSCALPHDIFANEATLTITRRVSSSDPASTLPSIINYQQRGQDWKITYIS